MKNLILPLVALAAFLFTDGGAACAPDHSPADPFHTVWFYVADTTTQFPVAVEGNHVYLPLGQGVIRCLEAKSGELLWSADSGGEITSPLLVLNDGLLVSLQSGSAGTVKKLDKTTGLTLWSHALPRPFSSRLVVDGANLIGGTADGRILSMEIESGKVAWSIQTGDVARGTPTIFGTAVYAGSDDTYLYAIEKASGAVLWKFKTDGAVRGLAARTGNRVMFGSRDGWFYSIDSTSSKLKWKRRAGAAIEDSNLLAGDLVLAGSYDNFLYAFYIHSGDSAWKVRSTDRLAFDLLEDGNAVVVAPLRGQAVTFFSTNLGEKLNEVRLQPAEGEIVARPVMNAGALFITTDKGLLVSRQGS